MMIECPHCHMETEHKVIDHINIEDVYKRQIMGMVSMLSTWATRAQDTPTDQVVSLLMGLTWHGLDYFAASDKKSAFPTE